MPEPELAADIVFLTVDDGELWDGELEDWSPERRENAAGSFSPGGPLDEEWQSPLYSLDAGDTDAVLAGQSERSNGT